MDITSILYPWLYLESEEFEEKKRKNNRAINYFDKDFSIVGDKAVSVFKITLTR